MNGLLWQERKDSGAELTRVTADQNERAKLYQEISA